MQMNTKILSILAAVSLAAPLHLRADEQNGLSVNVTRKTLERNSEREGSNHKQRQQQALKIEIKNNRLRPLPPGELKWTVLIKKRGEGYERISATKQIPSLMHGKGIEVTTDEFEIVTKRDNDSVSKDRTEYEIVVNHEGKQTYRYATASDFDALAAKARHKDEHEHKDEEDADQKIAENDPKKMPDATKGDGTKPLDPTGANPPVANTAKTEPPAERKVNLPPVDFFNLGGK